MATVGSAPEVVEFARGLRNDVDLIYEHIHDNFHYEPIFGLRRGAVGTIIDEVGNSFDQAAAMVALLREAGYTANFVYGTISLNPAQLANWLGVDSQPLSVAGLLGDAGIPTVIVTSDGTSTGTLLEAEKGHLWVKVAIDGTNYVFDPAFKTHTVQPSIDLATAMGYSQAAVISAAMNGATDGGSFIDDLNHGGLRSTLTTYANNLVNHIRTNTPAAGLEDVVGGRAIDPVSAPLRQTSLPYQKSIIAEWTDIPAEYRATLRLQYRGIDQTFFADEIYGKRLTLFFNASNQPELILDGGVVATGTATTPGETHDLTFGIDNPYPAENGTYADQTTTASIKAGGSFSIVNAFTKPSRAMIERHREILNEAQQSGSADDSEVVLGSSLTVQGYAWLAQNSAVQVLADPLSNVTIIRHHQIGIAGYSDGSPYVDLPAAALSTASLVNDVDDANAAFFNAGGYASAFESGVIEQLYDSPAASTISLIDLAISLGQPVYEATQSNWTSSIKPQLTNYDSGEIAQIEAQINAGSRVVLPQDGNLTKGVWQGIGFLSVSADERSIGYIISGGLSGGFGQPTSKSNVKQSNSRKVASPKKNGGQDKINSVRGDPVNLVTGAFVLDQDDFDVGSAAFPFGLALKRNYSGGARLVNGPFGWGWRHDFQITATPNSDGFQGLGEDGPIDAAAAIVALYVAQDLLTGAKTLQRLAIASMIHNWFMDGQIGNVVNVSLPGDTQQFVKLADGTFNPPPANASTLTIEADSTYLLKTKFGMEFDFNADGNIAEWRDPNGVTVTFGYTGSNLSTVSNGMGRTLTFAYTNDRISSVSDGNGRSVSYGYDASGNLSSFTNAEFDVTTYDYTAGTGLLTKVFKPSFPTIALISNTYDSLNRVKEQQTTSGGLWQYFYSGHRTDVVDPLVNAFTEYFNDQGRTVLDIDQLGNETKTEFDGLQRVLLTTLPEGNSVENEYDANHNTTKVTLNPKPGSPLAPIVRQFTYHPTWNRVATATDPLGRVTTNTFDASNGNLLTVEQPQVNAQTPTTTFTYDARGLVATITDPTGKVTRNTYDPVTSDLLSVIEDDVNLKLTTQFQYDAVGNATHTTDPRGNTTVTDYDNERRPVLVTAPAPFNFQTKMTYDKDGRVTKVERQTGDVAVPWQVAETTYTAFGEPDVVTEPGGHQTAFDHDLLDRVRQVTDAEGRIVRTTYDAVGRILEQREVPDLLAPLTDRPFISYTYTNNGQLETLKDGNDNTTTFTYDGFDRMTRTTFPDTSYEELTLDAAGNVLTRRTRGGDMFAYTYDALNRLDVEDVPYSATDIDYSYDLAGRLTSVADETGSIAHGYDSAKRLETVTRPDMKTVSYQYDAAGNRTRLTWPDSFYITNDYDELNRITHIRENGGLPLATYEYDDLSRPSLVTFNNGNGASVTYVWQPDDNDLDAVSHTFGGGASVAFDYLYNQVNQRASLTVSDDQYLWRPTSARNDAYVPNNLNQYSSISGVALAYDGNGNLTGDGTNSYTFDAKNRLIAASTTSGSANYDYDAFDRRVAKIVGAITTKFLLDGIMEIAEYDGADTLLRRYVYGPGITAPIAEIDSSGAKKFLHGDAIGSIVAVTDDLGAVAHRYGYGPFGEITNLTGAAFRYTGQRLDPETGLYYYRARYYNAAIGRFLSPDPIGYDDGPNLYAYVRNDPLNFIDPLGLRTLLLFGTLDFFVGLGGGASGGIFYDLDSGEFGVFGSVEGGGGIDLSIGVVGGFIEEQKDLSGNFLNFGASYGPVEGYVVTGDPLDDNRRNDTIVGGGAGAAFGLPIGYNTSIGVGGRKCLLNCGGGRNDAITNQSDLMGGRQSQAAESTSSRAKK